MEGFFWLFEFWNDLQLIIKIFVLLTIISFIRNHVENKPAQVVLILFIGWFVLFDAWMFFGSVYVLYMLLMFGISTLMIDFFFVTAGGSKGGKGMESPVSSGVDLAARTRMVQQMRRRPPG